MLYTSHNLHLELLSEIGIIGYLIFLTLIFIVFFEAIKLIINKNKISDESIYVFFAASFILCITLLFPIKSTGRLSSTFLEAYSGLILLFYMLQLIF